MLAGKKGRMLTGTKSEPYKKVYVYMYVCNGWMDEWKDGSMYVCMYVLILPN